ncbi:hypothetical protein [Tardiphaga sp.]|uniref:hypothetical protein n=1 Tax=Tardiphaga sp. TaxID=1926292 RepID=UPI00262F82A5|nr:hypothetical protein [Tardiphaga sp.]MDB5615790.1 hypothetical protein [Tardiphaga sp.]
MTSTLAQIAATLAGLAICATAFIVIVTPRSPLKGVSIAVAFGIVAALLITAARNFG